MTVDDADASEYSDNLRNFRICGFDDLLEAHTSSSQAIALNKRTQELKTEGKMSLRSLYLRAA